MSDDLTTALRLIRDRAEGAAPALAVRRGLNTMADSAEDVPFLLSAVEAVLKLADNWERETARLDALAQSTAEPNSRAAISMRAQAFEECTRLARETVARALTAVNHPAPAAETRGPGDATA